MQEEEGDVGEHLDEFEEQNVSVAVTMRATKDVLPGDEDAAVGEPENSDLEEEDQDLGGVDNMHDENKEAMVEEVSCVESLEMMVHDKPILFRQTFPENQCTSSSTLQGNGE